MKKLVRTIFSIVILLTLLLSLTIAIFAVNVEASPSATEVKSWSVAYPTVIVNDKEYHLYDATNSETILVNGKTYVRINSYINQMNNQIQLTNTVNGLLVNANSVVYVLLTVTVMLIVLFFIIIFFI